MYVAVRDAMVMDPAFASPVAGMRRLGVDAVEAALSEAFEACAMDSGERVRLERDEDAVAYGRHLEELGIRCCALLTARDFSRPGMDAHAAWVARAIEIAHLAGVPAVRIDAAMAREQELDFETRVQLFAEGLSGALNRTAGLTVTMGIENHGIQGNNLAFLLNVFQKVGSERLGSTLDTGNFYWRGYPLSEVYGILTILAPHAKHTHLKNIRYPAELREKPREAGWEYGRYVCPLDEGDIDHVKVVRLLDCAGYDGALCIEDESLPGGEARIPVLERDVAHVKHLLAAHS